jgi:hypothetical protein
LPSTDFSFSFSLLDSGFTSSSSPSFSPSSSSLGGKTSLGYPFGVFSLRLLADFGLCCVCLSELLLGTNRLSVEKTWKRKQKVP